MTNSFRFFPWLFAMSLPSDHDVAVDSIHRPALVAIGVLLGLFASFFTSRLAAALVFELRPAGLLLPAAVAALLTAVSFVAVTFPARRAARIEPLNALRAE